jgi:transposase
MMRVYIAGPMSGLPGFNYVSFNQTAKQLRSLGCEVENPAENPDPPCKQWAGYMRMAIAQVVKCDTLALLPNWHTSRGADLERRIALELGLRVVDTHTLIAELMHAAEATEVTHA